MSNEVITFVVFCRFCTFISFPVMPCELFCDTRRLWTHALSIGYTADTDDYADLDANYVAASVEVSRHEHIHKSTLFWWDLYSLLDLGFTKKSTNIWVILRQIMYKDTNTNDMIIHETKGGWCVLDDIFFVLNPSKWPSSECGIGVSNDTTEHSGYWQVELAQSFDTKP